MSDRRVSEPICKGSTQELLDMLRRADGWASLGRLVLESREFLHDNEATTYYARLGRSRPDVFPEGKSREDRQAIGRRMFVKVMLDHLVRQGRLERRGSKAQGYEYRFVCLSRPDKELPVHAAAENYPLMTGAQFEGLVEDIRANGLKVPIDVWRGQVLDGRNRIRACNLLGVKLRLRKLPDDTVPEHHVRTANLHRRHLSPAELERLRDEHRGQAAKLRAEGFSQRTIAERLGVSQATVTNWLKEDPESGIEQGCSIPDAESQPSGIVTPVTIPDPESQSSGTESSDSTPEAGSLPDASPSRVRCSDGRTYPAARSSPEDVAARRQLVWRLHAEGKSGVQVAKEAGIKRATVYKDIEIVAGRVQRGQPAKTNPGGKDGRSDNAVDTQPDGDAKSAPQFQQPDPQQDHAATADPEPDPASPAREMHELLTAFTARHPQVRDDPRWSWLFEFWGKVNVMLEGS